VKNPTHAEGWRVMRDRMAEKLSRLPAALGAILAAVLLAVGIICVLGFVANRMIQ
jgi:hypothetical protein